MATDTIHSPDLYYYISTLNFYFIEIKVNIWLIIKTLHSHINVLWIIMEKAMKISKLFYYPLKSGPAIGTVIHDLLQGGFEHDRSFMLVDKKTNNFVSLRDKFSAPLTQMAISKTFSDFSFSFSRYNECLISSEKTPIIQTTYRGHIMQAYDMGSELSENFSDILKRDVRLVRAAIGQGFKINGDLAREDRNNGFSDGYPLLITNQASLEFLQPHFETDKKISMARFRPNIVIHGAQPFEEDSWKVIEIGGVRFNLEKPCQRCVVTTKNPKTGLSHEKSEPIRTLNKLRRGFEISADGKKKPKVFFGVNAVPQLPVNGRVPIAVDMELKVIERYAPVHPLVAEAKIRHGSLIP